ncbi:hypothetical protein ACFL5O_09665 [Myxococcota bacterium]
MRANHSTGRMVQPASLGGWLVAWVRSHSWVVAAPLLGIGGCGAGDVGPGSGVTGGNSGDQTQADAEQPDTSAAGGTDSVSGTNGAGGTDGASGVNGQSAPEGDLTLE